VATIRVSKLTASCDLDHRFRKECPVSKNIAQFGRRSRQSSAMGAQHCLKTLNISSGWQSLFAIGLLAFVILRAAVVPRSFGQYGHYRGAAIAEIAARPIAFAGRGLANPATAMSRIRKSWASMWWWLARLATEHWPRTRMIQAPCNPRSSILRSCVPAVPRQTVRSPSGSRKWSRRITPEGSPATPAISPTAQRLKQKRV
jgi:hypothetical protein